MAKEKAKYVDRPRFDLINSYENEAKKAYQDITINTVKNLGLTMLEMVSTSK